VHSSSVVAHRLLQPCFLHVLFCYIRLLVSFCVSPENNKEKWVLLFLLLSGVDKTGLISVFKRRP